MRIARRTICEEERVVDYRLLDRRGRDRETNRIARDLVRLIVRLGWSGIGLREERVGWEEEGRWGRCRVRISVRRVLSRVS